MRALLVTLTKPDMYKVHNFYYSLRLMRFDQISLNMALC